jgi:hypothetical protein
MSHPQSELEECFLLSRPLLQPRKPSVLTS